MSDIHAVGQGQQQRQCGRAAEPGNDSEDESDQHAAKQESYGPSRENLESGAEQLLGHEFVIGGLFQ